MKTPRVRFTMRTMMVAVAVMAVVFGVGRLWRRSKVLASIAQYHASEENIARVNYNMVEARYRRFIAALIRADAVPKPFDVEGAIVEARKLWPYAREARITHPNACLDGNAEFALDSHEFSERASYHSRMGRKYERSARYPWLPVEPDPAFP